MGVNVATRGDVAPPAIAVERLVRTFAAGRGRQRRTVDAVRDVTLSIGAGERVAYLGPNGAGKSTTIKMLTGILRPTSGRVEVLGLVPWRQRRELARRIGTLFGQRSQLWAELTPRQSLHMLAAIHGLDRRREDARIAELAELLDAGSLLDVPARTLSLGQRMRCELAACMLHAPDVLFLDEPTIGLDLLAKQRFRQLLVRLNAERGTTVLLTSHDIADVEVVADRVIVMIDGAVIHDGGVAAMRRDLLATKLIEVTVASPVAALETPGVSELSHDDGSVRLVLDTTRCSVRDLLDDVLARWPVVDVSVTDPPLEQVIATIYGSVES